MNIVATIKPWNIEAFHRHQCPYTLITDPNELTVERVQELKARYIFFPHWSWKVSPEILALSECICFHMTDLPYGRGGSPLQNLILRGHKETVVCALRMTEEIDAGPIYLKSPLSLEGPAEAIYHRCSEIVFRMIEVIARLNVMPAPQQGEITTFPRRTPDQSAIPTACPRMHLYNLIRALDAETYPRAFIRHGVFNIEFSQARIEGAMIEARALISKIGPAEAS